VPIYCAHSYYQRKIPSTAIISYIEGMSFAKELEFEWMRNLTTSRARDPLEQAKAEDRCFNFSALLAVHPKGYESLAAFDWITKWGSELLTTTFDCCVFSTRAG